MLDIKLSFKPEIEEKDVSMYYGITVVVATDGSEQQLTQSFFDGCISDYNYLNQLLTDN